MNGERPQPPALFNGNLDLDWLIRNATGRGVRVGIIDSGIDAKHPALAGRVRRAATVAMDADGSPVMHEIPAEEASDRYDHGTGVAGIIADIAPDAELISIGVLNEYNTCTGEELIVGIHWALDQGIPLINMSLATTRERFLIPLFLACERAYELDSIVVASQRNWGDVGWPANFSSIISVTSEEYFDNYMYRFRPRNLVEFDASGVKVVVLARGGGQKIENGASFATPHVTGLLALIREVYPDINPPEAKVLLKALRQSQAKDRVLQP